MINVSRTLSERDRDLLKKWEAEDAAMHTDETEAHEL